MFLRLRCRRLPRIPGTPRSWVPSYPRPCPVSTPSAAASPSRTWCWVTLGLPHRLPPPRIPRPPPEQGQTELDRRTDVEKQAAACMMPAEIPSRTQPTRATSTLKPIAAPSHNALACVYNLITMYTSTFARACMRTMCKCTCTCMCACMRACVHAFMRACVHACMRACVHACMRGMLQKAM